MVKSLSILPGIMRFTLKRNQHALILSVLGLSIFAACNAKQTVELGKNISTYETDISRGEATFKRFCSACHNFQEDGIGPHLGGLTRTVSSTWIKNFIRNPRKMISEKDPRALEKFTEYNTYMTPFPRLTEVELQEILSFMHTFPAPEASDHLPNHLILVNDPIKDPVPMSNIVVDLEYIKSIPPSSDDEPLARINKMDCERQSGRVFIADLRGTLYDITGDSALEYFDLARNNPDFIDRPGLGTGFGSFAFHPNFIQNGLLYTTHTEGPGSAPADFSYADSIPVTVQYILSEWKTENPAAATFSGVERELLRVDFVTGKHGFQEIAFNNICAESDEDHGKLYVTVGEGGAVEDGYPDLSHHSATKIWGTILRIDPFGSNSKNGKYGIPKNNPFAADSNDDRLGEIWAYGFRNPHRLIWNNKGQLLATEIGARQLEEINLVEPGKFYGWPIREGRFLLNYTGIQGKVYELPADDSIERVTYPILEYDHDNVRAISGGYFYQGSSPTELVGKYLFGDITSDRLFFADFDNIKQGTQHMMKEWQIATDGNVTSFKKLCGDCNRIGLRFGRDCGDRIYIFTKSDGKIYRLKEPPNS